MSTAAPWRVDATQTLTRDEVAEVLADLRHRSRRSINARVQRAVFRLACCCGLRASEVAGLRLGDLRLAQRRPFVEVRKAIAKGGKARRVPLWWDGGTLADLQGWTDERREHGAGPADPLVCRVSRASYGRPMDRHEVRKRFRTACRVLGAERLASLTIHHGRHSFVSHALAAGRTLAEVRDAAGHSSVSTTSIYTHVAVDDQGEVGAIFGD